MTARLQASRRKRIQPVVWRLDGIRGQEGSNLGFISEHSTVNVAIKSCIFWLAVLFCGQSALVFADEIHLMSGNVIHTNRVTKQGGRVSYESHGGLVSVPASMVEKVVYGGPEVISPRLTSISKSGSLKSTKDLSYQLLYGLFTDSMIDKASLATVSIKTKVGHGSGFFISNDGYIITNQHVVRGSEQNRKNLDEKIAKHEKGLAKEKRELKRLYRRIIGKQRVYREDAKYLRDLRVLWNQGGRGYGLARAIRAATANQKYNRNILQDSKAEFNSLERKFLVAKAKLNAWKNDELYGRYEQGRQKVFEITLADKSKYQAQLVATSPKYDLALLKIPDSKTPYLDHGNDVNVSRGLPVYFIGSPIKQEYHNMVTSGIISGFNDGLIVTSAKIYPGNSGGPMISQDGAVVGIATQVLIGTNAHGEMEPQQQSPVLSFALPIGVALVEFDPYLKKL